MKRALSLIALVPAAALAQGMVDDSTTSPTFEMFLNGEPIVLSGEACREMVFDQLDIGFKTIPDPKKPHEFLTVPDIDPYSLQINQPFDGMKYMSVDQVKIESIGVESCTIVRDAIGIQLTLDGIQGALSGSLAYSFDKDSGMPFDKDKTNLQGSIQGSLAARLNFPTKNVFNSIDDLLKEYDESMDREEEDGSGNGDNDKFSTSVKVNVDKLTITAAGSPYAPLYNLLIEEYNGQIVNLLKFFSESQLSDIISNFCNDGDDQCTLANAEEWFEVLDHYVEHEDDDNQDIDEDGEGYDDAVEA